MAEVHREDVGTELVVDVGETITGATSLKINYRKPDGTIGSWNAIEYDSTHIVYTTLSTTDLDQAGTWEIQAYVKVGGWEGSGKWAKLVVYENLDAGLY